MTDTAHLYQTLLGADWDALPAVTRALHAPAPDVRFDGTADIVRGESPAAWLTGLILRLPAAGKAVPARVSVNRSGSGELLERWDAGRRFATLQRAAGGLLVEDFGPFCLSFRLIGGADGIRFHQTGVRLWGLALPGWMAPRVEASERAAGDAHHFDVHLTLPGLGTIIRYSGRLRPA